MQTNKQVELYYWLGDNPSFSGTDQWEQAKTADGKNAIVSFDFEHKINSPAKAKVVLSNTIPNFLASDADSFTGHLSTLASGSDSGTQSPLFTDFMRVILVDAHSKLIYLYGRIYDIQQEYNSFQGYTTTLDIKDELEMLRGLYVDEIGDVSVTSSTERSDVIKDSLINSNAWSKPSAVDIAIDISDTGTNPEDRLQTSAGTYPATDTIKFSKSSANVLQEINNISQEDPQSTEDSDKIAATYGYDYYLDTNFGVGASGVDKSGADTTTPPSPHFNYFKRGDRPNNGNSPQTYGLSIEFPTGSGFSKTGQKLPMLSNFDFERPKYEVFTDATVTGVRVDKGRVNKNFELLNVTSITQGGSSANFKWAGTEFDSNTDTTAVAGTGAAELLDLYTADGSSLTTAGVCRVQYQSTESGDGYILISDIQSTFPQGAGQIRLVGATTGAHCLLVPSTGRFRNKFPGVKRTFKTQWGGEGTNDALRRKMATQLSRAGVTGNEIVRGSFNIAQFPYYHVDNVMTGSSSATTFTFADFDTSSGSINDDPRPWGLKPSMPIGVLNSNGTHFSHYNYTRAVTSTTATVHDNIFNESGGTSNIIPGTNVARFYVPIRAGDFIYVKNHIENIAGNFLITKISYNESPGVQNARLEVVGKDTAIAGKVAKVNAPNVSPDGKGTDGDIVPKGSLSFSFPVGASNTKVKFFPNDDGTNHYRSIEWTAGPLLLGNGELYQIAAGNTGNMVAYDSSSLANEIASTYYLYWAPDDPDAIRAVLQSNWETTETSDTVFLGWARSASDNAGTYVTNGKAETNVGNQNPDGLHIGGSHVITGGQFQTRAADNGSDDAQQASAEGRIVIKDQRIIIYDGSSTGGANRHIQFYKGGESISGGDTAEGAFMSYDTGFGGLAMVNFETDTNMDDLVIWAQNGIVVIRGEGDHSAGSPTVVSGGLTIQNTGIAAPSDSGDPALFFTAGNLAALKWSIGADAAASYALKFGTDDAVGTNTKLTLDTSGNLTVTGSISGSGGSTALDDIGAGDAASTLATSAGNITIDAQGNNTDIIFKGTTGTVDTTFLTIDGSTGGDAILRKSLLFDTTCDTSTADGFGVFRFTAAPDGSGDDVLAFNAGQSHATPASANNDSVFWTMWTDVISSTSSRLHFEPIDNYDSSTTKNFAYIGFNQQLVGINAFYNWAGGGSASLPGHSFAADQDTGMYNISADRLGFTTGGTQRLIIDSDGTSFKTLDTGASANDVTVTAAGLLKKVTSSKRYKENIVAMTTPSEKIYDLQPSNFIWKKTGENDFGLIAEQVHEILPELSVLDEKGRPEAVRYTMLSVLLLNEVQKLKKEIEELKENK